MVSIPWLEALRAESPHATVKMIENVSGLGIPDDTPATTPYSVMFRVIARTLAMLVDDRHSWDVRSELYHSDDARTTYARRYAEQFPTAGDSIGRMLLENIDPNLNFWALLRDNSPVGVFDTYGIMHRSDGDTRELFDVYRGSGHSITHTVFSSIWELV